MSFALMAAVRAMDIELTATIGRQVIPRRVRARLHSALGYSTPVEHEQLLTMTKPQPAQVA